MSPSPELPDLDRLEALARAADLHGASHLVTHYRLDADIKAEEAWRKAATPAAVLALIALARRAQPEGEAPQAALRQVAGMLYDTLNYFYQRNILDVDDMKKIGAALATYNRYRSGPAAQHAERGAQAAEDVRDELRRRFIARITAATSLGESAVWGLARMLLDDAVPALAAQSQGAQAALLPLSAGLPSPEEHDRVLIYTDGVDFAGEQFFDVRTEELHELLDQKEVVEAATHWMPRPRPGAALAAKAEAPAQRVIGGQRWSKEAEMTDGWLTAQQAAAPGTLPDLLPPMGIHTDRDMLNYLMVAFDNEIGTCERCGHSEPTKHMDSAGFLRDYLAAAPSAPGTPEAPSRDDVLEEAAGACESEFCSCCWSDDEVAAGAHMAAVIRGMKSGAAQLDGGQEDPAPADCSGTPSSCPDNEGYGCHCSDKRLDGGQGEG